jgi:predicted ATP-binding protein involved in virulence
MGSFVSRYEERIASLEKRVKELENKIGPRKMDAALQREIIGAKQYVDEVCTYDFYFM